MNPLALWCLAPERTDCLPASEGDGVPVTTMFSGISRGTEKLVWQGLVPESEYARMRGPAQEGEFSFPVKYGYAAVGTVAEGPRAGETVFALHPHQNVFRLPDSLLTPVPPDVPAERAVLAANMETALTILWDSGASAGDRILIIGAGLIGSLVAYLATRLPGAEVTVMDTEPSRRTLTDAFGGDFVTPDDDYADADVVIHCSATEAGLRRALQCAGPEATVVEASWHGTREVSLPLGQDFHSKRIRLIASQVGSIPADRVTRWDHRRRLETAMRLLGDPVLDVLISGETPFEELPAEYGTILSNPNTLCHRVRYRA